jgi:hypothetical protein
MHMIRHHDPRVQKVAHSVEMTPSRQNRVGVTPVTEQTRTVARIEETFDRDAAFFVVEGLLLEFCESIDWERVGQSIRDRLNFHAVVVVRQIATRMPVARFDHVSTGSADALVRNGKRGRGRPRSQVGAS